MNITFLTNGTRGDLQPLIYLAQALTAKGETVTIAAGNNFQDLIEGAGIRQEPMPVNLQDFMNSEEGKTWFKKIVRNPFRLITELKKLASRFSRDTLDAYWRACSQTDLIISTTGALGDVYIARQLNVPLIEVQLQPLVPTKRFSYPLIPLSIPQALPLGALRKLSFLLMEQILWGVFKRDLKKWQQDQFGSVTRFKGGAFAQRRRDCRIILGAYSPAVIKRPEDWPGNSVITGFLRAPSESADLESEVQNFLKAGAPPIYVGFGSMSSSDDVLISRLIDFILKTTSHRIIYCRGWSNSQNLPESDRLLVVSQVNHRQLFPCTSGIFHHGGAGTTAEASAAGVPQIILPFTGDQPFWADRIYRIGAAPKPWKLKALNKRRISRALEFITDPQSKEKAAELAQNLRHEDGIACSVNRITEILYP